jgi:hypothetical protein
VLGFYECLECAVALMIRLFNGQDVCADTYEPLPFFPNSDLLRDLDDPALGHFGVEMTCTEKGFRCLKWPT